MQPCGRQWARLTDARRAMRAARELYAAAGYSARTPLEVELWYPMADPDTRRLLEAHGGDVAH